MLEKRRLCRKVGWCFPRTRSIDRVGREYRRMVEEITYSFATIEDYINKRVIRE